MPAATCHRLRRPVWPSAIERAVLLVGHAGHGTVMKALWRGTPMVLIRWGRDQPGVAARARALGVAAVVPRAEASAATIAAAANRVLTSKQMHRAAQSHAARLRRTDAPATAANRLEALL